MACCRGFSSRPVAGVAGWSLILPRVLRLDAGAGCAGRLGEFPGARPPRGGGVVRLGAAGGRGVVSGAGHEDGDVVGRAGGQGGQQRVAGLGEG